MPRKSKKDEKEPVGQSNRQPAKKGTPKNQAQVRNNNRRPLLPPIKLAESTKVNSKIPVSAAEAFFESDSGSELFSDYSASVDCDINLSDYYDDDDSDDDDYLYAFDEEFGFRFNPFRHAYETEYDEDNEGIDRYIDSMVGLPLFSHLPNDPRANYAQNAERYLNDLLRNPNTSAIVRARIRDLIIFSWDHEIDAVVEIYRNFRTELAELSGLPLTDYPVYDESTMSARPSPALSESEIAGLPRHIYRGLTQREKRTGEPPHKCCICMAELEEGEELIRLEKCSHRFHFDCLQSWLRKSNQCPVCRAVVKPGPIVIN